MVLSIPSWSLVGTRLLLIVVGLGLWFFSQSLIGKKSPCDDGIGDWLHQRTAGWHQWLLVHPQRADRMLIVSSLFIDLFGVSLLGMALFGPTVAPFVALVILFGARQLCQGLVTLPPPPGVIWRDPGFPSLLVTYGVSNDLFFSGHTALAVLGAIEAFQLAPPWLGWTAVVIACLEASVVLVLRAHYTLDIIAGALAAWWASNMAAWLSPLVDRWLH